MHFSRADALTADKILAERHLIEFVRLMWPAVEPGRRMVQGWVLDAICEHLEAVSRGEVRRLVINVPPGCSKSLLCNVFFPAWMWGPQNRPQSRFLSISYSQSLTIRDNVRFRQVLHSSLYKQFWGDRFTGSVSDASKIKFANNQTGWKIASSLTGTVTGERGDFLILDDPNSVDEAESDAIRDGTNTWLRETMPTRLNDPVTDAIICIQQRVHEEDATGTLLDIWDDPCRLVIPMEYESERHCETAIGWSDPRDEDGQLAWPRRFPANVVDELKRSLGPYASAGQLQQSPVVRGGSKIRRDWWQPWSAPKYPPISFVVAALDTAYTEDEENDPSALCIMGTFVHPVTARPSAFLIHVWVGRLELHELVNKTQELCLKRHVDVLLIENKAAGKSLEQEYRRLFSRSPHGIQMVDYAGRGRDKVARVNSIVPLMADGAVYAPADADGLPATKWCDDMITEAAMFPRGAHDDRVDAFVMCMRYLRDNGMLERKAETSARELDENMYTKEYRAPYAV